MHRLALFRALGIRAAAMTATAMALVLGIGLAAGWIRLLPWLVSEAVPLRVALPFAKALAAAAFEAAALVGLPLGWALAAAISVERGEARALFALGVGPWRMLVSTFAPAMAIAAAAGLVIGSLGRDLEAPGRFAGALFDEGRAACVEGESPRAVHVPLVSATWLCFEDAPPRLVGSLAGERTAPFTASSLRIGDGLDTLAFEDLHLYLNRGAPIRLHVERASVEGLRPWARASKLGGAKRGVVIAATGAWLAIVVGWVVLRSGISARTSSIALGLAGPLATFGSLSLVERTMLPTFAYISLPLAATGAIFLTLAIRGCVPERWTR